MSLFEELDDILSNQRIQVVFQPIVSLKDGDILGHEALSRLTVAGGAIHNTEMLFTAAEKYLRLWELEVLCRTKVFEAARHFMTPAYNKKLFINVNPNIMNDESFKKGLTKDFLNQYQISPRNVIFEITERNMVTDMNSFVLTIDHYKSQNYKIAIDDVGSGYSGLKLINNVNPNYIKIDMSFIRNIDKDSLKFALVKGLVELSKVSNIYMIAEGIETEEELQALIQLGVHYGQGYYIQKPHRDILEIRPEVTQKIKAVYHKHMMQAGNKIFNTTIEELCAPMLTIPPSMKVAHVYDLFRENPDCFGLCVVENSMPVGIVTRSNLALALSGNYGYSLYQHKSISVIMDKDFLAVDCRTPINVVSTMAMSRSNDKVYDFIVITKSSSYLGTVTIKDLLQKTTEIEVSAARQLNPLTGLPGNLIIEQRLTACIEINSPYSVAYIDIDNFKAYNDVYGFEKGDMIIQLLANILKSHVTGGQFIGHVGGDDFVIIMDRHVSESYFSNIITEFEHMVMPFYQQSDIDNGYVLTRSRQNIVEKIPLVSLSLVVVNNQSRSVGSTAELAEKLAVLKTKVKQEKRMRQLPSSHI